MEKYTGWYGRRWGFIFTLLGFCLIVPPQSVAGDLTDKFTEGFTFPDFDAESALGITGGSPSAAAVAVAPAIAAAISQAVTQEFPLASVAPAFTYRFNPSLNVYERSSGVPGPLFSERSLALGKGQFNFGVGYSYIDFSELNGTDLHDLTSPGLILEGFFTPTPGQTNPALIPVTLSALHTRIDLQAHVVVPAMRYGITEDWDISLAIPIVNTFLRVRNEVVRVADLDGFIAQDAQRRIFVFDRNEENGTLLTDPLQLRFVKAKNFNRVKVLSRSAGSATGVGDISLRTKYHLWHTESGGAAVGLNLTLPSGEVRDFQGSDDVHLGTFLYLSQVFWDRFEPHLNVGLDINGDDVDRNSFVYAVGASFLVWQQLGFIIDFIGRTEFSRFAVDAPGGEIIENQLDRSPDTCTTAQPCVISRTDFFPAFPESFKRNDIADFSFGFRYTIGTAGSVFFGGIVPLNDDGLRADFIPSGGIEYTF